jgi:hypothetical protein
MRTYGRKDFTDFNHCCTTTYGMYQSKSISIGELYDADCLETKDKRSILLMEAKSLPMALDVMRESFLYNSLKHEHILEFYGCYMIENTDDDEHGLDLGNEESPGYQVGIITEHFDGNSLNDITNQSTISTNIFRKAF